MRTFPTQEATMPRSRTSPLTSAIASFDAAHVYVLKPMPMRMTTHMGPARRRLSKKAESRRLKKSASLSPSPRARAASASRRRRPILRSASPLRGGASACLTPTSMAPRCRGFSA